MSRDDYLQDRLDDQIQWYDEKADWNQRWFRRLQLSQIAMGALIPFVSGAGGQLFDATSAWPAISAGLLGVMIAFTGGALTLYSFHGNWSSYRTTAEALKRERALFAAEVEPYGGDDAFNRLVTKVEGVLASEASKWEAAQDGSRA